MAKRRRKLSKLEQQLIDLLAVNAYMVYSGCIVGNRPPILQYRFDVVSKPQVGDLVVEVSSLLHGRKARAGCGRLLAVEQRQAYGGTPGRIPMLDVYVIGNFDGGTSRWKNCQFVKILENYNTLQCPVGYLEKKV